MTYKSRHSLLKQSGLALCALTMIDSGVAANSSAATASPRTFAEGMDPFVYCARVGTTDSPAGGASSAAPPTLLREAASTLGMPADAKSPPGSIFWRCMDGAIYVCAVGANLVCDSKADRAKTNAGADNFCRDNTDAKDVPAYATGHATIYEWHCAGARASRGRQVARIDRRGYAADIWHKVTRP